MDILTSIHGKRLGLGEDGTLILDKDGTQALIPTTRIVDATAATLTVTKDAHEGRVVTLNRAAGVTATLPDATGSGDTYRFFVATTVTSNSYIIQVPDADNVIQGILIVATDTAGETMVTTSTSDTITMNGSTTGGVLGSYIELTDVAADTWLVGGALISTGVEATPFSAAVS